MDKRLKIAFINLVAGLIVSVLFHLGVMLDLINLQQKYILYINLALIVLIWPGASISRKFGQSVVVEGFFETAMKIFPAWLKAGLGIVLVYGILIFIYYTYINSPLTDKHEMTQVLIKLNKGASAGTIVFYAAQFSLLNLYWRVKRLSGTDRAGETTGQNP